ncbi:helix-turn-helix domain-containing protein [Geomonas sp. Red32]|uniref:helix-turn-helix domain-containing protein n=1 Tax=Geomonas sp. Red32 TaxID=2912856 RepID=UPI00202CBD1C|nr:helix-turn-helix transcriptional regulator [Geomonas sp. Red32]MCM0081801.1 helix-turn-helix domain-containing protein [Geomonas sp. Red32]
MTVEQLKKARRELGLNQTEMANTLKTSRRTYLNWELGVRRIPGVLEVAVEGLLYKDRQFMARVGHSKEV